MASRASGYRKPDNRRILTMSKSGFNTAKCKGRGNLYAVVCFSEFAILAGIVSLLPHTLKKELNFLLKKYL